jgi:hypothetical protein
MVDTYSGKTIINPNILIESILHLNIDSSDDHLIKGMMCIRNLNRIQHHAFLFSNIQRSRITLWIHGI